jgi:outer membrane protein TolC
MLDWMARSNPELGALEYEIARNKTKIRLAEKDYFPDITLGLDYINTAKSTGGMSPSDDGKDPLIAMLSINLPIWRDKLAAGVREARHRYWAAALNKTDKVNSLNAELKLDLYRFRDANRKIDLFRDTLLPKARESLRVTEASFRAGKTGFLDLIDAQRILLQFELDYERALANRGQQLAKLEMLVGQDIPRVGNSAGSRPVLTNGNEKEQKMETEESDHE